MDYNFIYEKSPKKSYQIRFLSWHYLADFANFKGLRKQNFDCTVRLSIICHIYYIYILHHRYNKYNFLKKLFFFFLYFHIIYKKLLTLYTNIFLSISIYKMNIKKIFKRKMLYRYQKKVCVCKQTNETRAK